MKTTTGTAPNKAVNRSRGIAVLRDRQNCIIAAGTAAERADHRGLGRGRGQPGRPEYSTSVPLADSFSLRIARGYTDSPSNLIRRAAYAFAQSTKLRRNLEEIQRRVQNAS